MIEMHDQLAFTVLQRYWAVPGMLGKQLAPLDIGGSILGGLASSRLDQILVRDEKLAVQVSAGLSPLQRAGIFTIAAYVRPGVDPLWCRSGSTKSSPIISPRDRPRMKSSAR